MLDTHREHGSTSEKVRIVRISGRQNKLDALPPSDTRRWVTRRKAQVVNAVRNGLLTVEEACQRYSLSTEEFSSWQSLLDHHGMRGLRATRAQNYKDSDLLNGAWA
jgi:transposase-like protein